MSSAWNPNTTRAIVADVAEDVVDVEETAVVVAMAQKLAQILRSPSCLKRRL
jgi:hypothetical protein